jgi:hypothetical protein
VEVVGGYSKLRSTARFKRDWCTDRSPNPRPPDDGLTSPRRHKLTQRLSDHERSTLIEAYVAGAPSTELMERFNLGKGSVLAILDEAGVLRKRRRHIADHLDEAAHLYIEERWSLQQIGQHLGFAGGTIYRHLKQRGVVMRRPWEYRQQS